MKISKIVANGQCWQTAFRNAVLPGGLAGAMLRAIELRTDNTFR